MSATPPTAPARATLADLALVSDTAELIGGRIVHLMPTGHLPNRVAANIFRSLDDYCGLTGRGVAFTDNIGFAVSGLFSERESFSPDASFYLGPLPPDGMDFIQGPPTFAVEVRCKGDYGDAAEEAMAAKRADYFEAGTLVIWDVDPKAKTVRVYRAGPPEKVTVFIPGQEVEAEPAVAGWRMAVDRIFP